MSFQYQGTLYNTERDAQVASIYDYFTACGMNTVEEALELLSAPDITGYTLSLELLNDEWTLPGLDLRYIHDTQDFEGVLETLIEATLSRFEQELSEEE